MNKTQRAKGIAKFFLLTTPAIALVLFGIHLATYHPEPGTPPAVPAAKAQASMIDQLLPVPDDFKSAAKIIDSQDSDYPSDPFRQLRVRLPRHMSEGDADIELLALAREAFEDGAKSVYIMAVQGVEEPGNFGEALTELTLAPKGDVRKIEREYDISEYQVVINHRSRTDPDAVRVRTITADSDRTKRVEEETE